MKKNLLIVACLYLSIAGAAFSAETINAPTNSDIKQKACQNVFSLINIDLSVMSPRATGADIIVSDPTQTNGKKENIVPLANKTEPKPQTPAPKNKTSLFRVDLLHIFKIQIL